MVFIFTVLHTATLHPAVKAVVQTIVWGRLVSYIDVAALTSCYSFVTVTHLRHLIIRGVSYIHTLVFIVKHMKPITAVLFASCQ